MVAHSPMLFAAAHVLRRHSTPRHPPHAPSSFFFCPPSGETTEILLPSPKRCASGLVPWCSVPSFPDPSSRSPPTRQRGDDPSRSRGSLPWSEDTHRLVRSCSLPRQGLVVSSLQLVRCKTRLHRETDLWLDPRRSSPVVYHPVHLSARGRGISSCAPTRQGSTDPLHGGDAGSRTPYLLRAKQALFQLSYIPPVWWGILDSNQGPQSYQDCALTT